MPSKTPAKKQELIAIPEWLSDDEKRELETAKKSLIRFLVDGITADFSKTPFWARVFVCQKIPKIFISSRVIASKKNASGDWGQIKAPYIKHHILKRYAAFLFSNRIQNELVSKEFTEFSETKTYQGKSKTSKGYTAEAHVRFKVVVDGEWLTRDVYSSWKQYESKATTRGHCLQSAMSRSWAVMLESFGVGSNLVEQESRAFEKARDADHKVIEVNDDLGEEANTPKPATEETKTEPIKKAKVWDSK